MNGCGNMANIAFKSSDEYALKLSKLAAGGVIAKKAIYKGAGVIADQIRGNIDTIKGVHDYQKADLKAALGITPIKEDSKGNWNAKVGFDGYGSRPTKKYKKGVPNQMLARSVESGTSFRPKTPFVRNAMTTKRKAAIKVMQETIDEECEKIMK